MEEYRVELDVYHGPLDLLLYLIRRDEIDIHNIPIHHITEQYLRYCQTLQSLDINLAGEFLVMAATLMEIKSAMMARAYAGAEQAADPAAGPEAVTDPTDPRFELVQQLLAYKRFKDAARGLEMRQAEFAARFPRLPAALQDEPPVCDDAPPELDLEDVGMWDLLEAFTRLMEQVGGPPRIDLQYDDTPIELHQEDIADRLSREGPMTLQKMFAGRKIGEMIGLFLAMLELLRQGKIKAHQEQIGGEIQIEPQPESQWISETDVQSALRARHDPMKVEAFDWPDEEVRKRYQRRVERRLRGEKIKEDEEFAEDLAAIEAEENVPPPSGQADSA